jgi:hypothetical protein
LEPPGIMTMLGRGGCRKQHCAGQHRAGGNF